MSFCDPDDPILINSVVRLTLNRPLTWAERNHFYELFRYEDWMVGWVVKQDGKQLIVSSILDSRWLVEELSAFLEAEYLNVFPKSAYTIYPEVRV